MLPTPILKLEKEESSALLSNLNISSLTQCVLELLYNALDAEANSISVGVNTENYYVNVQDNGLGIRLQDLENLARPNYTSKMRSWEDIGKRQTYGFRGEALSCISQMATLEVISRHDSSGQTFHGIWRDGQLISLFQSTTDVMASSGTIVIVRDLFHKHPIRRKNIEIEKIRRKSTSSDITISGIKRSIEKLALTRYDVAWSLNDLSSRRRIMNLKAYKSSLKMFQCIYGHDLVEKCKENVEMTMDMKIEGFISLKLHNSKIHRYIYLNDNFVRFGPAYTIVDKLILNASLPNVASGSKYTAKFPIYLIRVKTNVRKNDDKDMLEYYLNEDEESNPIIFNIKQFVLGILSASSSQPNEDQIELDNQRRLGKRKAGELQWLGNVSSAGKKLYVNEARHITVTDIGDYEPQVIWSTQETENTPQLEQAARSASHLNTQVQTGYPANEHYQYPKLFKNDGLSEVLSSNQLTNAKVIGQADKKFIVFSIPVPLASYDVTVDKSMIIIADQHAIDERIILDKMLKSILGGTRISDPSRCLASENCILLSPPRNLQVSSSEAEKALQYRSIFNQWGIDFFTIPYSQVSVNPQESNTTSDSRHFRQLRSASKYFDQKSSIQVDNAHYIQVTKIPRVISDRCATNPILLKQIICDHIGWIESQAPAQQFDASEPDDDIGAWSRYLRYCPRGIVDILKSKACRSAIMFNDSLTHQQCQKLMDLVSDCAYPFQCAHGRLSMVPLIKYNHGDGRERSNQRPSYRRIVNWSRFERPQH
ncbi:hypothetical protein BGW37DRAFT_71336 [Umbelopsis sp. PMI_123]|nr:hypothetical protein BGW37DRAFT_71336 [Umbelopsis sp. PMI_123]